MAIVSKTNPIGIDAVVDSLQNKLQTLVTNNEWTALQIYPRAYKNETDNGIKPEIFTEYDTKEYQEVLFDDNYDATCFFLMNDNLNVVNLGQRVEGNLSIIFQVKLPKIKPSITHRADEEVRYDILRVLERNRYNWEITNIITGIDNVYTGFNTDGIQWTDMSEWHVFRIEMSGTYNVSCLTDTDGA